MEGNLLKIRKLRKIRVSILNRKQHLLKKQLDAKCEEKKKLSENIEEFSFIYRTYSDDMATQDVPLKSYKLSIQKMSAYRDRLLDKIRLNEINLQNIVEDETSLMCEINEVNKSVAAGRKSEKKIEFLLEMNKEND